MIVEGHDRLQPLPKLTATRLLIRDDYGNPLVVAVQSGLGVQVLRRGDPNFVSALRQLGLDRSLLLETETLRPQPPRI